MFARLRTGATVSGQPEHVVRAIEIDNKMAGDEATWVAGLRAQGVKAARPDDGWVDREHNTVAMEYPQFNDGLAVGDLLALGWPWSDTRIVRVTEHYCVSPMFSMWRWKFEEVAADV